MSLKYNIGKEVMRTAPLTEDSNWISNMYECIECKDGSHLLRILGTDETFYVDEDDGNWEQLGPRVCYQCSSLGKKYIGRTRYFG